MLDIMPQKLIRKNDLNNWGRYSDNISNYVKKYLQDTLKYWIEHINNPLSIRWVLELFEGEIDYLDKTLKELEEKINENDLKDLIKELPKKTKYPSEITKKILSLNGELYALNELSQKYKNIKRIYSVGDWECDDTIFSIKSILDLDFNYQVMENHIRSLFFIEENNTLRNYDYILLQAQENIDDKFREKIISFLEVELINLLIKCDSFSGYKELVANDVDATKSPVVLIRVSMDKKDTSEREVIITIREDRSGKLKSYHQVEIILKDGKTDKIGFSIEYDTDCYWEGCLMDRNKVKSRIEEKVKEFDKGFQKSKEKNKYFEGWINVSVHSMHEGDINKNKDEIWQFIKGVIGTKNYKIHVSFSPQMRFDLEKPVILDF